MKSQMINNYRDKMGGLVSSGTKIQMAPNYRDEKHILPFIYFEASSSIPNNVNVM
jgi:hypothetical protein